MCGRFTLASELEAIEERFDAEPYEDLSHVPRFNVAPSQELPIVAVKDGKRVLRPMRWGLVPSWAKDVKIGYKLINARAETLAEKPSFKKALEKRRCIVPADSFYEWKKEPGGDKTPTRIFLKDQKIFGLAGLWEYWKPEEMVSFTIITVAPNPFMESIHNRMPAILTSENEEKWLAEGAIDSEVQSQILKPYLNDAMQSHAVSRMVNSPKNDQPELIEPVAAQESLF